MTKNFAHLNAPQRRAIETTEGRVLVLAGAGSGKTSVIAYRIAHLIENRDVSPAAILGLTFTNKAAAEMRERVAALIGGQKAKKVTLCTFHSFCMQVLRKEIQHLGFTNHFSLYDERDVKRLVNQLARHILEHDGELPSLEGILHKIQYAKCRGIGIDEKEQQGLTKELFERLQVCMRAYNAVDFDSLLSLTVRLFEEHPDVLKRYQEQYRYIMIDEYQDTNPIQYRLAKLLSASHHNLCVVGDDDQSIYGWRGAEIKNILHFESSTIVKLEQNYRSTPMILHAANAVISRNTERHAKELWSAAERGDPIFLFHAPTEIEEAQSVVQRMVWLRKEKKLKWSDMAILYRSNVLARTFEMALMQTAWEKDGQWLKGVPYQVFGGTEFYERAEVKDLMSYLKVILNPCDQESLLRIINVPRRGISDQALDILTQINRKRGIPLWQLLKEIAEGKAPEEISDRASKGIAIFVKLIETAQSKFATPPLHATFSWLLEEIDYRKAIEEEVKSEKMRDFKWENVMMCLDALVQYEETEEEISLHHFLSNTLLDQDKIPLREKEFKEDKVNLMTFHSAKGLEFEACFLVCLEDHIIPHEKSLAETGLEEERRLMYVAMTRAKKILTLSMSRQRKRYGKDVNSSPSRFLFEIPKELLKVTSWQTVSFLN